MYQQGAICLDTLGTAWSPVLTIKSALLSLQSLLSTPEPKDPQDAEVANMLIRNPKEFERQAREWAVMYAGAPRKQVGESSGGATSESMKKDEQKSKEEEEREQAAVLVHPVGGSGRGSLLTIGAGTKDTTNSLLMALWKWALMSIESLQLSNTLA